MTRSPLVLVAVALLVGATLGCASTSRVQQQIEAQMRLGDYPLAIQTVEQERARAYRGKNRLLYDLERGMLLHLSGHLVDGRVDFFR